MQKYSKNTNTGPSNGNKGGYGAYGNSNEDTVVCWIQIDKVLAPSNFDDKYHTMRMLAMDAMKSTVDSALRKSSSNGNSNTQNSMLATQSLEDLFDSTENSAPIEVYQTEVLDSKESAEIEQSSMEEKLKNGTLSMEMSVKMWKDSVIDLTDDYTTKMSLMALSTNKFEFVTIRGCFYRIEPYFVYRVELRKSNRNKGKNSVTHDVNKVLEMKLVPFKIHNDADENMIHMFQKELYYSVRFSHEISDIVTRKLEEVNKQVREEKRKEEKKKTEDGKKYVRRSGTLDHFYDEDRESKIIDADMLYETLKFAVANNSEIAKECPNVAEHFKLTSAWRIAQISNILAKYKNAVRITPRFYDLEASVIEKFVNVLKKKPWLLMLEHYRSEFRIESMKYPDFNTIKEVYRAKKKEDERLAAEVSRVAAEQRAEKRRKEKEELVRQKEEAGEVVEEEEDESYFFGDEDEETLQEQMESSDKLVAEHLRKKKRKELFDGHTDISTLEEEQLTSLIDYEDWSDELEFAFILSRVIKMNGSADKDYLMLSELFSQFTYFAYTKNVAFISSYISRYDFNRVYDYGKAIERYPEFHENVVRAITWLALHNEIFICDPLIYDSNIRKLHEGILSRWFSKSNVDTAFFDKDITDFMTEEEYRAVRNAECNQIPTSDTPLPYCDKELSKEFRKQFKKYVLTTQCKYDVRIYACNVFPDICKIVEFVGSFMMKIYSHCPRFSPYLEINEYIHREGLTMDKTENNFSTFLEKGYNPDCLPRELLKGIDTFNYYEQLVEKIREREKESAGLTRYAKKQKKEETKESKNDGDEDTYDFYEAEKEEDKFESKELSEQYLNNLKAYHEMARARSWAMFNPNWIDSVRKNLGMNPNEEQIQSVAACLDPSSPVSIVNGGPGTGKTAVISMTLEAFNIPQSNANGIVYAVLLSQRGRLVRNLGERIKIKKSLVFPRNGQVFTKVVVNDVKAQSKSDKFQNVRFVVSTIHMAYKRMKNVAMLIEKAEKEKRQTRDMKERRAIDTKLKSVLDKVYPIWHVFLNANLVFVDEVQDNSIYIQRMLMELLTMMTKNLQHVYFMGDYRQIKPIDVGQPLMTFMKLIGKPYQLIKDKRVKQIETGEGQKKITEALSENTKQLICRDGIVPKYLLNRESQDRPFENGAKVYNCMEDPEYKYSIMGQKEREKLKWEKYTHLDGVKNAINYAIANSKECPLNPLGEEDIVPKNIMVKRLKYGKDYNVSVKNLANEEQLAQFLLTYYSTHFKDYEDIAVIAYTNEFIANVHRNELISNLLPKLIVSNDPRYRVDQIYNDLNAAKYRAALNGRNNVERSESGEDAEEEKEPTTFIGKCNKMFQTMISENLPIEVLRKWAADVDFANVKPEEDCDEEFEKDNEEWLNEVQDYKLLPTYVSEIPFRNYIRPGGKIRFKTNYEACLICISKAFEEAVEQSKKDGMSVNVFNVDDFLAMVGGKFRYGVDYTFSDRVSNGETDFVKLIERRQKTNGEYVYIVHLLDSNKRVCIGNDHIDPKSVVEGFVCTVDSMMGSEKKRIVFIVSANDFWVDDGRLMVAMTRAQQFLDIVAIKTPMKLTVLEKMIQGREQKNGRAFKKRFLEKTPQGEATVELTATSLLQIIYSNMQPIRQTDMLPLFIKYFEFYMMSTPTRSMLRERREESEDEMMEDGSVEEAVNSDIEEDGNDSVAPSSIDSNDDSSSDKSD